MKILKQDKTFSLFSADADFIKELPLGIYTIGQNPMSKEFYLIQNEIDVFELPEKIYGRCQEISDRVLKRYFDKNKNLGVLLNGKKGSGKSLTAKLICNAAKLPIIILKQIPEEGDLIGFLSSIIQKYILFVDEFEKVCLDRDQEKLLPLLDGWGRNNILTLFTSNNDYRVNEYLKNRPSRIYYKIDFKAMNMPEINEIINDKLIDKSHTVNILRACNVIGEINIDVLNSIIEEINFTDNSDINELMYFLNIESESISFDFTAKCTKTNRVASGILTGFNPLVNSNSMNIEFPWESNDKDTEYFDEYYKLNETTSFEIVEQGFNFTFREVEFKLKKRPSFSMVF